MAEKLALLKKKNGIATITINSPKTYNALSPAVIEAVIRDLQKVQNDPAIRVVILTGTGKAFCAGGNLDNIEEMKTSSRTRKYIFDIANIINLIVDMPKPVIAMVNGVTAGAGFNLALACDIIFCARSARFSQSFVKLGLIASCGATYFVPRAVGLYRAKEIMFTGDFIDAERVVLSGLANRVVDDGKLKKETYEFAEKLTRGAPIAIGLMKKVMNHNVKQDFQTLLELEVGIQSLCVESEDHKEGIAAVRGKRPPVFKGK
jgi:2-(1,2-epoxy-1,2-dihydrophenyl)acetyl-CoA isomerase